MILIFVHGWSVSNTNTYGELPEAVAAHAERSGLKINIHHIYLGRYISFHDEVTVDDISRAFDMALREQFAANAAGIEKFSCVTHSTGGPVIRHWLDRYYGSRNLADTPLQHLIMLAPANHGSPLAALGKSRVGRIKAWFQGLEPGQGVLDWLCLGSTGQWQLNERFLHYRCEDNGFYPFVLTGQRIDSKLYDHLNPYTGEKGSDGVVRVCGANLNYRYIYLEQNATPLERSRCKATRLELRNKNAIAASKPVALGVFAQYSHSGKKLGIMRSVERKSSGDSPIVAAIIDCLAVASAEDYRKRSLQLEAYSRQQQTESSRFCQLVFAIHDHNGQRLKASDFDIYLLAGKRFDPGSLPKGFFCDRQLNRTTNHLVYYLNADLMNTIQDGCFGIRVVARPDSGFSYYQPAEYQSNGTDIERIFRPNETTYIDITLTRHVDENTFRLDKVADKPRNFARIKPSGKPVL
jgi:hypothetical protein